MSLPTNAHSSLGITCNVVTAPPLLRLYRLVNCFLLIGIAWKSWMSGLYFTEQLQFPLHDDFFPAIMRNVYVMSAAYLLPIGCCITVLLAKEVATLRCHAIVCCVGMSILMLHQGTYNDVTFQTVWWTSLWCLWFTFRLHETPEDLIPKARGLAVLILSIVFLGGGVGKWTSGYWSGQVLYEIYFVGRNHWCFALLRHFLSEGQLAECALWYSRFVLVLETCCGLLFLLPPRWAGAVASVVLLSIVGLSNIFLLSVIAPLLGLSVVAMMGDRIANNSRLIPIDKRISKQVCHAS